MRLPVWLLNLLLRLTVRRALARVRHPRGMRRSFEARSRLLLRLPADMRFETVDIALDGRAIRAGWAAPAAGDTEGVILYLHGGGYVAGSPATHRAFVAKLSRASGAAALVPDYRLAPEHPFPAAVEDALASYRYLLARGHAPERIAIAGDSAGGGLAAAVLLGAAGAGLARPGCILLYSPWADLRATAPSIRENASSDAMLPVVRMTEVVEMYLGDSAVAADPRASPILGRYHRPPPALIFASRHEILRDDAVGLQGRLAAAGGEARLVLRPHVPHAWPIFAGWIREADAALEQSAAFLREHLAQTG